MTSIAYIEDVPPRDAETCPNGHSEYPDDLVLTGVLYRVEDGVYLMRAGTHHRDAAGRRRRASAPYRHEATQGVVTDAPEGRVIRAFIAWFDDRAADWNRALRIGVVLAAGIRIDLSAPAATDLSALADLAYRLNGAHLG